MTTGFRAATLIGRDGLRHFTIKKALRTHPAFHTMTGPASFLPVTPLIAAHVATGIGALIAGAVAMLAVKGGAWHRRAGVSYLSALALLAISGGLLALEDLQARDHLLGLGLLAFLLAAAGYAIRLRQRPGWRAYHLLAMGASYIAILTAFYVDNGPRLPLWWRLPTWALWMMPSFVGALPLRRAWHRYRGFNG